MKGLTCAWGAGNLSGRGCDKPRKIGAGTTFCEKHYLQIQKHSRDATARRGKAWESKGAERRAIRDATYQANMAVWQPIADVLDTILKGGDNTPEQVHVARELLEAYRPER